MTTALPAWETCFAIANTAALAAWLALVLLPRWRWLLAGLRLAVPLVLAVAYTVLVLVYFFRVEGGGFGTLAEVQRLFASEPVALAGWLHYLAFDLLVGLWIAERQDSAGTSRLLQAPILLATFLFGPVGFLLHHGVLAAGRLSTSLARLEARPS